MGRPAAADSGLGPSPTSASLAVSLSEPPLGPRKAQTVAIADDAGMEDGAAPATLPLNERGVQERLSEHQRRLKKLMEVNRKLHSTLAAKKILAAKLKKQNEKMLSKLEGHELEEMGRHRQLHELQGRLQREQTGQQADTLSLQKAVMSLEEKIEHIADENHGLTERHKQSKATITEQQNTIKILTRRTKELSRHIDFMSGHLHEAVPGSDGIDGGGSRLDGGRSHMESPTTKPGASPRRQKGDKPRRLESFQRLPGLDLELLIGQDAAGAILNPDRPISPNDDAPKSDGRAALPEYQRPSSRGSLRRGSSARSNGRAKGAGSKTSGSRRGTPEPPEEGQQSGAAAAAEARADGDNDSAAAGDSPPLAQPVHHAAPSELGGFAPASSSSPDLAPTHEESTTLPMFGSQPSAPP